MIYSNNSKSYRLNNSKAFSIILAPKRAPNSSNMCFNFSGSLEFLMMNANKENFQKIGKVVVLRVQKSTRPPFRP